MSVNNSTKATIVLQAPRSGTFTLAVCQNVSSDCRSVDSGGGANPMSAYTFTSSLVGGIETKTALVKGKGSCNPSSNTLLSPRTYSLVASFPGSKGSAASKSGAKTLVVKK